MSTRRGPLTGELSVETRLQIDAREKCGKPSRDLFHKTKSYKKSFQWGALELRQGRSRPTSLFTDR